jgi:hypothetical protein
MTTTSFQQGFRDARQTLGWLWPASALVLTLLCVGIASWLEAQGMASTERAAANELRLLTGATFGLLVPLFGFALAARLDDRLERLIAARWPRHGADRRVYALGRLALAGLMILAVGICCSVLALGASAASGDPKLDLHAGMTLGFWSLTWISVQAAASYAACFGLAQLWAGSWGRSLFLIGDWLLGSGIGIAALPWPRSHLRSLLGGAAVLDMQRAQAQLCLLALALSCTLLYARRVPR